MVEGGEVLPHAPTLLITQVPGSRAPQVAGSTSHLGAALPVSSAFWVVGRRGAEGWRGTEGVEVWVGCGRLCRGVVGVFGGLVRVR